jgi:transcriptional regulator with XRE-family HTH domain
MGDNDATDTRFEIGNRLAEERDARGLNQDQLAGVMGKSRRSVAAWEAGASMPDADALAAADKIGIDVLYVLTGRRGGQLTAKEHLLVSVTHGMPEQAIDAVIHTAQVMGTYAVPGRPQAGVTMTFESDVQQAVGGNVTTSSITFQARDKGDSKALKKPRK